MFSDFNPFADSDDEDEEEVGLCPTRMIELCKHGRRGAGCIGCKVYLVPGGAGMDKENYPTEFY